MPTLHIANTQFEWELTHPSHLKALFLHPLHAQLQFLPFLYASAGDRVLLFHKPDPTFFQALKRIRNEHPAPLYFNELDLDGITQIESWGASKAIQTWAEKKKLSYRIPNLSIIKQLAAKAFTFERTPRLPNASALRNRHELEAWLHQDFWPKVLKINYETAGRGLTIIPCKTALHLPEVFKFCEQEWSNKRAVIGEPWVQRTSDFSTQWRLNPSIELLGFTEMQSNRFGTYKESYISKKCSFDLEKHKSMVLPLLEQAQLLGFFSNLGIDGFIFQGQQHVTEINPRKTMGWVALELAKILNCLELKFKFVKPKDSKSPLLPFQVHGLSPFKMQLDLMSTPMVN